MKRRSVARYEEHVTKLDHGFIDLFWPGLLIVEQKSAGRDLNRAYGLVGRLHDALDDAGYRGHRTAKPRRVRSADPFRRDLDSRVATHANPVPGAGSRRC